MLENKIFEGEDQIHAMDQTKKNADYGIFTSRPFMSGLLSFFILFALFSLVIYQRYVLVREAKIKVSSEAVNLVKDKIEETITYSVSAAKTLSFCVDQNGTVHDFDSISVQILHAISGIDALQLVPEGVIRYVYPLQENEAVIGYDILKDPTRNKEAFKAIEKKEMFFAGPFPLRQGGMGVVGRLPLYRQGKFWGFSAVIIKLSTLLETAGIDSSGNNGYHFQLSKLNPNTKKEEYFLPVKNEHAQSHSVSVQLPGGEWKLSGINTQNYKGFGDVLLLAILGLILSVMGGVFVYRFAIRPKKLDELVKKRTQELKNSENKYRSLIERVSDAFVSLDKNWQYTYVNRKAGEIFNRRPEMLLGRNIWTEYPEGVDQPFYHAYYRAMQSQTYQYLEEYYPPFDKWFENHIYPSTDGLTIFFKDVTEIKKVSLALKNNEEKYRSLIEHASDGIVITNLDGEILEVNNSVLQMIGFENNEILGHHLTEFLPEEDHTEIPLRISELLKGKSLLYERRLFRKDGSVLDVEINSRMASTHTLIGFIRDISQRKKTEADLLKSTERFELIAEATNDVIWDHDFRTNRTWGNKNLYKLYGTDDATEVDISFERFMNNIHPDDREELRTRLTEAISNRKSFLHEEFRFKLPNGEYRHYFDRAYIKYDSDGNPVRIMGAMQDVTERYDSQNLLQKSYEEIRELAGNLQSIREDERTNIAREIHDELGQQLTGLKMDMHWLSRKIKSTDTEIIKKMDESIELINATISSVRKISTDLRPSILDDLGLLAALEWQSEEFQKRSGIKVEFVNNVGDIQLRPDVSTAVFRIYQELLTNIARHANANHVNAELNIESDRLKFTLEDDGVGFDPEKIKNKKTLGLLGIKERSSILGGTYEFQSIPGKGSETRISIPINKNLKTF